MPAKAIAVARQQIFGLLALFVALGGTSYAVATGSIDSREIKNNTIRSKDIRNNQVRSKDVRNGSLLNEDFKAGQLPAGPQGPQGPQGAQGERGFRGPAGPVEAELFSGHFRHPGGTEDERQFFAAPGVGTVDYHDVGSAEGGCFVSFTNTSGQDVFVSGVTSEGSSPTAVVQVVGNNATTTLAGVPTGPAGEFAHVQVTLADGTKVLELTSSVRIHSGACVGAAQGTLNG